MVDALETNHDDLMADMYLSHVKTRVYDIRTYKPIINVTRDLTEYWYVPIFWSQCFAEVLRWPAAVEQAMVQAGISQVNGRLVDTQPTVWLSAMTGRKVLKISNPSWEQLWTTVTLINSKPYVPVVMTMADTNNVTAPMTRNQDYAVLNTSTANIVNGQPLQRQVFQC